MKKIAVSDITLRLGGNTELSFKEKLELAREIDRLGADIIELPPVSDEKTDALFVRTLSTLIKSSIISCPAGFTQETAEAAWDCLKDANKPRLQLIVPVSPVKMEYACGMKPEKVLEMISFQTAVCASMCADVEFSADDATRSEADFLVAAISRAIESGAKTVSLCDSAGIMLPDEYASFIKDIYARVPALKNVCLSVECSDTLGLGAACAVAAIQVGAGQIKTSVNLRANTQLKTLADIFRSRGDSLGFSCGLDMTGLQRSLSQIEKILTADKTRRTSFTGGLSSAAVAGNIQLDAKSDINAVAAAVKRLGYELSPEDFGKVNEAVIRITANKTVGPKELDAIIAGAAMQVPSTYRLSSYVITSGNLINATASVQLDKNGTPFKGLSSGDGPIDAAFLAIEQIIGHHYELDDFQIQSVTEGREAMGSALVKLRSNGKLYSGEGLSTDIIGASILAYVNALNKIIYEGKS
jgi:2-isopropylmalate synthase